MKKLLLFFLMLYASKSKAFVGPVHNQITRDAATIIGVSSFYANIICYGNNSVDDISNYWDAQERHFTSSYFADGLEAINTEWETIQTTNNKLTALLAFGRILHSTQDFYSHSNWVELYSNADPIPIWNQETINRDMFSCYWPNHDPSFSKTQNTPNHETFNKDSEEKTQSRKRNTRGRSYFDIAKDLAYRATVQLFNRFMPIFDAKSYFGFDDFILLKNANKAYFFAGPYYFRYKYEIDAIDERKPVFYIREHWKGVWFEGIDASFNTKFIGSLSPNYYNWYNPNKLYMFKGSEYIRYDVISDKADDGYPKPISLHWRGLWSSNIDAVVYWKNEKVYFFKGSQYIRYDLKNDRADEGYPKLISAHWPGLWADGIDGAVNWENGKIYFFKGEEYIRWDINNDRADADYPKKISDAWGGF
ncbi:MAG TPA: hemopexin repeat-containing protein [Agriterribacter sp.]|nr:hemopexin repeat-containing protein [Agriterribacter sp.]